jgi:hypothetical protein
LLKSLFDQINSLILVKDSKIVILFEKDHQYDDAEEEIENKIQGFTKKILASWTRSSEPGQLDQIYVNKS